MINFIDILQILQIIQQLFKFFFLFRSQCLSILENRVEIRCGYSRNFSNLNFTFESLLIDKIGNILQIGWFTTDLRRDKVVYERKYSVAVIKVLNIISSSLQSNFHQLISINFVRFKNLSSIIASLALAINTSMRPMVLKHHWTLPEVSKVPNSIDGQKVNKHTTSLLENVSDLSNSSVLVVRLGLNDESYTTRSVSLICNFRQCHGILGSTTLQETLDVVLGHVDGLGLGDSSSQL